MHVAQQPIVLLLRQQKLAFAFQWIRLDVAIVLIVLFHLLVVQGTDSNTLSLILLTNYVLEEAFGFMVLLMMHP